MVLTQPQWETVSGALGVDDGKRQALSVEKLHCYALIQNFQQGRGE